MGSLIQTFTFDRNTFRRTAEESADSVAEHIEKVVNHKELDKTASNIVGALASYMGIFSKTGDGKFLTTRLATVFLNLRAGNKADSWRWLVARSLWRFVVPNGTASKVNDPAKAQDVKFAFFPLILQLLTHLSALSGEKRFLYFEELCRLFDDDRNWSLSGDQLFVRLTNDRMTGNTGFGSQRSFLADLENKSDQEKSEFNIPRDNFNGLILKALAQTGLFEFQDATNGRKIALALNPSLDEILQRRLRFILDHPPSWNGTDWPSYMDLQAEDLPQEVTAYTAKEQHETKKSSKELTGLIPALKTDLDAIGLHSTREQLLRLAASIEAKRFLILTGLAGSGKTKLAQAFARWITPVAATFDPFVPGFKIQSDKTIYHVNASDKVAVEFWNSEKEEQATKVSLPREMINEWATYIQAHKVSRETPAREIREAVKITSKFSDQLHSFETHLKAAAFALLNTGAILLPEKYWEIVPVGADWTGNENVLGYPNGLDKHDYVMKPALDLILRAQVNEDMPYFLILDEMNLSHVERYFADLLSAIESEEKIPLAQQAGRTANGKSIPEKIALPKNLFIVGTVNVDETTYMFSPKVLDRANVIEFRMDTGEFEGFLGNPGKPDLSKLDGKGVLFSKAFVEAAKGLVDVPDDVQETYEAEMLLFFNALRQHGAEFGYRVAHEAARFIYFYRLLSSDSHGDTYWFNRAFDCVVFQKLLPKLHGSRAKLGPLLKSLWFLCVNDKPARGLDPLKAAEVAARSTDKKAEPSTEVPDSAPYQLSAGKVGRMWRLLNENGFASFAEA